MRLNCKISYDILEQYSEKYSWIPKKKDILLNNNIENIILTDYYSFEDYVLINIFQEKRIIDINNKFFIKDKSILSNKKKFIRNKTLSLEINHYVLYYYIDKEPTENQVILEIKDQIVNIVGNENIEFVVLDSFSKDKENQYGNIYIFHVFWSLK